MGACARNMYSDPAEIKPAQCCIKEYLNTPDDGRLRPKHVE